MGDQNLLSMRTVVLELVQRPKSVRRNDPSDNVLTQSVGSRSNEADIEANGGSAGPTSPRPSAVPRAPSQRNAVQSTPSPSGASDAQPSSALPHSHLYAR